MAIDYYLISYHKNVQLVFIQLLEKFRKIPIFLYVNYQSIGSMAFRSEELDLLTIRVIQDLLSHPWFREDRCDD